MVRIHWKGKARREPGLACFSSKIISRLIFPAEFFKPKAPISSRQTARVYRRRIRAAAWHRELQLSLQTQEGRAVGCGKGFFHRRQRSIRCRAAFPENECQHLRDRVVRVGQRRPAGKRRWRADQRLVGSAHYVERVVRPVKNQRQPLQIGDTRAARAIADDIPVSKEVVRQVPIRAVRSDGERTYKSRKKLLGTTACHPGQ